MAKKLFIIANILFIMGVFVMGTEEGVFDEKSILSSHHNQWVSLWGMVCEETDNSVDNQKITFCVEALEGEVSPINEKILISAKLYPDYDYGDFLFVRGILMEPTRFPDFKYDRYLARYGIYSVMYYAQTEKTEGKLDPKERTMLALLRLKWRLKEMMDINLSEPSSGLANALLLGYRRTVDREDLDIFSRVGLSHMIAISGSHITIMSGMVVGLFMGLGLSRKKAMIFVWVFLFFYPLITGLQASAVRSAIMGGFGFLSIYSSRKIPITASLLFSGSIMLVFNPNLLRDDVGFQLSFLAVLGIVYLFPIGDRLVGRRIGKKWLKGLWDIVNLTLVSQVITMPVLIINFKQLSLISPVANILVLWVFGPLLAALIIALFFSYLLPILSLFFFWPSYLLLQFIFYISKLLASISWAAIDISNFTWFEGILYYIALLGVYLVLKRSLLKREAS